MTETAETRVERAMLDLLNDVDKTHLRALQVEMHRCAIRCCEDKEASVEAVHACIDYCNGTLKHAQKYVQNEFFHLQNRLQRCVMSCNDQARDTMTSHPTKEQVASYSAAFDVCVEKCVDSHISLLPNMMKKMKQVLSQKEYQTQEEIIN